MREEGRHPLCSRLLSPGCDACDPGRGWRRHPAPHRLPALRASSLLPAAVLGVLVSAFLPAQTRPAAPANPASQQAPPLLRDVTVEERADIYLARKSYADAIDYYHRALRQQGSNANLWNKLGIAYQLDINYRAARKAYKEAAKRRTDFAEPWNNLGTTYFMENKFRKSVKYYRQALDRSPGSASFHMNLGASYSHMKKFPQAVEQYREALSLDPNVLTEHSSTATVVQARGADVEFYFYLAKVFASLARPEDSVRYLRRALEDGFKDLKRLDGDPDFQKISHYPAYVELRKNLPVAISD